MSGVEIYEVTQDDPLGMRAVKLDIGEWAYPVENSKLSPQVGERVCVVREGEKIFWLGFIRNGEFIW